MFLAGNRLPERWMGRERFVILETGFGLGLNFLATWHAWRADPGRCGRLHYLAAEKHPFARGDLATLHERLPELTEAAARLRDAWPLLVPGYHRLHLDAGRVVLTLMFGAIADTLPKLRARADALYLDGFAPAKNPDMWSPQVFRSLAHVCAPGATLATWSVAGSVRDGLAAAGFATESNRVSDRSGRCSPGITRRGVRGRGTSPCFPCRTGERGPSMRTDKSGGRISRKAW